MKYFKANGEETSALPPDEPALYVHLPLKPEGNVQIEIRLPDGTRAAIGIAKQAIPSLCDLLKEAAA